MNGFLAIVLLVELQASVMTTPNAQASVDLPLPIGAKLIAILLRAAVLHLSLPILRCEGSDVDLHP